MKKVFPHDQQCDKRAKDDDKSEYTPRFMINEKSVSSWPCNYYRLWNAQSEKRKERQRDAQTVQKNTDETRMRSNYC